MRKSIKITIAFLCAMFYQGAFAQETTHWTCSPNDFQFDMTAYIALTNDGVAVTDYSDYEVAAFCGDECRGVGEVQTVGTTSYIYMRIRSNAASGENITFKVFDKSTQRVINVQGDVVAFQSDGTQGAPAEPWILDITKNYTLGDANGDGVVNVEDAEAVFNFYMTGESPNFSEAAADFDGDGTVDLTDAVLIYEFCMSNQ